MKRILLIITVVALCMSIFACGKKNGADQTSDKQNNSEVVETTKDQGKQTDEDTSNESSIESKEACVVISSTKTALKVGDEFTLTVSIKDNPGIFAFAFELPVDNKAFEFVSADTSASVCTMLGVCDYDESTSSYKFNGFNSSPFENITADGTIVTITMKVKDSAAAGTYTMSATPDAENIINVEAELVEFASASISLNVTK